MSEQPYFTYIDDMGRILQATEVLRDWFQQPADIRRYRYCIYIDIFEKGDHFIRNTHIFSLIICENKLKSQFLL